MSTYVLLGVLVLALAVAAAFISSGWTIEWLENLDPLRRL